MVKNLPANGGDTGLIPGLGGFPGGGNGNLLQYSCWENPMDRGACWAIVQWDCKESNITEHTVVVMIIRLTGPGRGLERWLEKKRLERK